MPRKSTSKRLRFEVFKRDGFTCQYCGAQPPSVVLVADHIHPVADGGETSAINLITSCEPCNQGKADKPLGDRIVRPDADLMYLEAQQEIAEYERYAQAMFNRDIALTDLVETFLATAWRSEVDEDWEPHPSVVRQMIAKYPPEVVEDSLRATARSVGRGHVTKRDWVRYLWGTARNLAAEPER